MKDTDNEKEKQIIELWKCYEGDKRSLFIEITEWLRAAWHSFDRVVCENPLEKIGFTITKRMVSGMGKLDK